MDTDLIFWRILGLLFLVTRRYYERKAAATTKGDSPGQDRVILVQIMRA